MINLSPLWKEYQLRIWEEIADNPPPAPWVEFPDYQRGCAGWRMGDGEDCMFRIQTYFKFAAHHQKQEYIAFNPEPDSWNGFYNAIGDQMA